LIRLTTELIEQETPAGVFCARADFEGSARFRFAVFDLRWCAKNADRARTPPQKRQNSRFKTRKNSFATIQNQRKSASFSQI